MPSDLEQMLNVTAATPARPVDIERIAARVRRRRVVRRGSMVLAGGLLPVLLVGAFLVAGPRTDVQLQPGAPATGPDPAAGPAAAETRTDEPTPGELEALERQRHIDALSEELRQAEAAEEAAANAEARSEAATQDEDASAEMHDATESREAQQARADAQARVRAARERAAEAARVQAAARATELRALLRDLHARWPALPEGCTVVSEGGTLSARAARSTASGLAAVPLGPAIRTAVDPGVSLGPLVAVASDAAHLASLWGVLSAVAYTGGDQPRRLGVATWYSPDPLASFNPAAGVTLEAFEADPAKHVLATHVRAADSLAARISGFALADEALEASDRSRSCALAAVGAPTVDIAPAPELTPPSDHPTPDNRPDS